MTVSISPTLAPKTAAPDAKAPAKDGAQAKQFVALIGTAEAAGAALAPQDAKAPEQPPADQSLEALLQALKLTLTPGAALVTSTKKPGDAKQPAAKDQPGQSDKEEAKEDAATALFAALNLAPVPAATTSKAASGQVVDDVLSKPAATPKPAASVPDLAALAPTIATAPDLSALADLNAVKGPDAATQANVQVERMLDTARDAAWLDRLSQDIAASAGSGDKLKFRMMPPSLGALDVSVERQAAGMSVSMTTHTTDARNLIADARQQMVDSLKAQGVPLVQLSLSTAGEEPPGHRPPTFFNQLIEAAPASGTDLAAQPVESTTAERVGRFA
jgi:flagellar hook-length control protein FliK